MQNCLKSHDFHINFDSRISHLSSSEREHNSKKKIVSANSKWVYILYREMQSIVLLITTALLSTVRADWPDYEGNIKFQIFKDVSNPNNSFYSFLGDNMEAQGCPSDKNCEFEDVCHIFNSIMNIFTKLSTVTFLLFGYTSSNVTYSGYALDLIKNFLAQRGGCVCYVDYTYYTNNWNYFELVWRDFHPISNVVIKKVQQVGNYNRIFMYGFSFGARVAVQAGMTGTNGQIGRMNLCEPVGILFDNAPDPKRAAKSVECIHTSGLEGTTNYNCHIDWRLGLCGIHQFAANLERDSHQFCNYFYISSFSNEFKPFPYQEIAAAFCFTNSSYIASTKGACSNARMGYLNPVDATVCRGQYFVPTSATYPYIG